MKLDEISVDIMLSEKIQAYIDKAPTFEDLRAKSLAMQPIPAFVGLIETQLQDIAEKDKSEATTSLTQRAHKQQEDQDAREEEVDTTAFSQNFRKKQELDNKIQLLQTELTTSNMVYLVQQGLYNAYKTTQLTPLESRISELEQQILQEHTRNHDHGQHRGNEHLHGPIATTKCIHGHHNSVEALEKDLKTNREIVAGLRANESNEFALYFRHENNKNRLESAITRSKKELQTLEQEQQDLTSRQTARTTRSSLRNRNPHSLISAALSSEKSRELDNAISRSHAYTTESCRKMKSLAQDKCYPAFLKQVESQISTLILSDSQREALNQIVEKMNEHQRDLLTHYGQEQRLQLLQDGLRAAQQQLVNLQKQFGQLTLNNQQLADANERLNSNFPTLEDDHNNLVKQRDLFTLYSLTAAGVSGAGAISAYFLLQAGVIALVPGVNMGLAAVAGAVLLALVITSIVTAIQASFKQAEKETCSQTITSNRNTIDQNNLRMHQSQGIDVPNLHAQISTLNEQIVVQTTATAQAKNKARDSFHEASAIRTTSPVLEYDPQNSFFAATTASFSHTPSAPYEVVAVLLADVVVEEENLSGKNV